MTPSSFATLEAIYIATLQADVRKAGYLGCEVEEICGCFSCSIRKLNNSTADFVAETAQDLYWKVRDELCL